MEESNRVKHFEIVQNIITRMNKNSFQIKRMTVILVSAFLALAATDNNSIFILVATFPVIVFWFLDSFYLSQERKFRGLYNDLVKGNPHNLQQFEITTEFYKCGRYSFLRSLISKTILCFYFSILISLIIVYYIFKTYINV